MCGGGVVEKLTIGGGGRLLGTRENVFILFIYFLAVCDLLGGGVICWAGVRGGGVCVGGFAEY